MALAFIAKFAIFLWFFPVLIHCKIQHYKFDVSSLLDFVMHGLDFVITMISEASDTSEGHVYSSGTKKSLGYISD